MIRVLITGANSFIGNAFGNWLQKWPGQYQVDIVDMIDGSWREKSFAPYAVVFHVAGIAHVSSDRRLEPLYYRVNRDLAVETATKAKADGVRQFIFMSSIIVYGDSSSISQKRVITRDTLPNPSNFYGDSKLQAEKGILPLQDSCFNVVVLRPPMIYGQGSRGNYPRLAKIARKLPLFPQIQNERSMLYIDNLCEFVRLMIDHQEKGIFFPQNREYVSTSDMVKYIAQAHSRKIALVKWLNPALKLVGARIGLVNKVFGNLVYDQAMSDYQDDYRLFDLNESIRATEEARRQPTMGRG